MRSPPDPPPPDDPPGQEPTDEAWARAIVETVQTPLLVLGPDLRVVSANPAFLRTFETSREAVVGRRIFDIGGGHWDVPGLRELLERIEADEERLEDVAIRHRFEHLGWRAMRVNARRVRLGGVEHHRILLALEDETDRVRNRRALRRYSRELERSNRDLEEFAHAASHDLQEPLRKIRTYAERLENALDPAALDDRTTRYLEGLVAASERMQTRIEDLLQLARVGRSGGTLEPVELEEVVQAALADLEVSLREAEGTVTVAEMPRIEGDPAELRLLFQNLIGNAVKYRSAGRPLRVEVEARRLPGEDGLDTVEVTVSDNGIGFEEQYAERIFQPFFRLHGRAAYEGSGVGLAVCRRVVERHRGTLRARAVPGEGSRFSVVLPVRHDADVEPHE